MIKASTWLAQAIELTKPSMNIEIRHWIFTRLIFHTAKWFNCGFLSLNHPAKVRFQVVDLGKGHVALKAANGRLVSIAAEAVILKDLAGKSPGDAESFQ